ncbi:hypothetical protein LTR62_003010 [Meristemomyces frigidus]|uniref:Uncharacterized protein n=1 Tax=Meristemomyces frigidus TaxID=1508187 RepID=A0AAN7TQA1_9PEZI|nr:hypothetical protein LTR62_003010 [Meristemomyces frigidus]
MDAVALDPPTQEQDYRRQLAAYHKHQRTTIEALRLTSPTRWTTPLAAAHDLEHDDFAIAVAARPVLAQTPPVTTPPNGTIDPLRPDESQPSYRSTSTIQNVDDSIHIRIDSAQNLSHEQSIQVNEKPEEPFEILRAAVAESKVTGSA